jgi:hypothetical protein
MSEMMMKRRELQAIQRAPDKRLQGYLFGPGRKGRLPRPLDKLGGEWLCMRSIGIRMTPATDNISWKLFAGG